jgi:hypothetical protein
VPAPSEWVTVRQLPDGEAHSGRLESCDGQQLQITVPPESKSTEFISGGLIEVKCEGILYLGVILSRQESVMLVGIEHAVDRIALAALQDAWRSSPRE